MGEMKYCIEKGYPVNVRNTNDYKKGILDKMEKLPFYTDDPDDPHWRCENCGHCKEVTIHKRIINYHPEMYHDNNGIQHKNENIGTVWVTWSRGEFETVNVCELLNCEIYDDQFCEDFIEQGDE